MGFKQLKSARTLRGLTRQDLRGSVPGAPCVGREHRLYQVDIPPIQPETWKFAWPLGVWSAPWPALLISKAFEVGTVHFGPRLLAFAAFQKMICGVSYDRDPPRAGMLGFPVARSKDADFVILSGPPLDFESLVTKGICLPLTLG